jgi:hypothetical protein
LSASLAWAGRDRDAAAPCSFADDQTVDTRRFTIVFLDPGRFVLMVGLLLFALLARAVRTTGDP